ncbi:DUF3267 domain-containing protein [Acetivibrio clariflavus]|uniref:Zincin peptidase n=1 Tax=Acetivibrio clariflavus (strain DSM 19732 / NBRC 101661 / EBR45) TaxID=720554 RepID=G8LV49_ACECE|nr:DUF3267 domain-containing protein [Acetivibrio clariflavus]AEV69626.1 Protein of unknown function (DUF3267) [Acetivibrio clariflavus DSM 19732]
MPMVKVAEFKLNKKNSLIFNILSILIFTLGLILFGFTPDRLFILVKNNMLISLSIPIVIVFIHEAMHAIAYKMFGAKLKIGYRHFSIYITDISGNLFTPIQISIIMLFPLFCIPVILFIASGLFTDYVPFLVLAVLINSAGSIGDMILLIYIISKGKSCRIKDEHNGFSLYKVNLPGST